MSYEIKEGQGSLFQNNYKEAENHPDMKGKIKINGKDYSISAWHKTAKSGTKFISLSVKEWIEKA